MVQRAHCADVQGVIPTVASIPAVSLFCQDGTVVCSAAIDGSPPFARSLRPGVSKVPVGGELGKATPEERESAALVALRPRLDPRSVSGCARTRAAGY